MSIGFSSSNEPQRTPISLYPCIVNRLREFPSEELKVPDLLGDIKVADREAQICANLMEIIDTFRVNIKEIFDNAAKIKDEILQWKANNSISNLESVLEQIIEVSKRLNSLALYSTRILKEEPSPFGEPNAAPAGVIFVTSGVRFPQLYENSRALIEQIGSGSERLAIATDIVALDISSSAKEKNKFSRGDMVEIHKAIVKFYGEISVGHRHMFSLDGPAGYRKIVAEYRSQKKSPEISEHS